jgi:hypothetical protein
MKPWVLSPALQKLKKKKKEDQDLGFSTSRAFLKALCPPENSLNTCAPITRVGWTKHHPALSKVDKQRMFY